MVRHCTVTIFPLIHGTTWPQSQIKGPFVRQPYWMIISSSSVAAWMGWPALWYHHVCSITLQRILGSLFQTFCSVLHMQLPVPSEGLYIWVVGVHRIEKHAIICIPSYPQLKTWERLADMPVQLCEHAMVCVESNIFVFRRSSHWNFIEPIDAAFSYQPDTNQWTTIVCDTKLRFIGEPESLSVHKDTLYAIGCCEDHFGCFCLLQLCHFQGILRAHCLTKLHFDDAYFCPLLCCI